MIIHDICAARLVELGKRLRSERLKQNDRQEDFAARIAVSVPTLRKMENGDPTVQIGAWVAALYVLGQLDDLSRLLVSRNLFEEYDRLAALRERKRAKRRPKSK